MVAVEYSKAYGKLRTSSPAPSNKTRDRGTSVMMRAFPNFPIEPARLRAPCCKTEAGSSCVQRHAGARPKRMPVTTATDAVRESTRQNDQRNNAHEHVERPREIPPESDVDPGRRERHIQTHREEAWRRTREPP
jgi:hypothetical protein